MNCFVVWDELGSAELDEVKLYRVPEVYILLNNNPNLKQFK